MDKLRGLDTPFSDGMNSGSMAAQKAALSAHVITETLALRRFYHLLEAEHSLGSRRPKGRTLYQVICRGEEWVALVLWTSLLWHKSTVAFQGARPVD